ncbi:hypothetical protein [Gimibacter soli]|uniref:Uncharacterized protein n=1 Tax=Gimibacter soli TaxID=3024400 RepID=A0AAF0BIB2_9PROT|nr:hypothetical protein [Gimibacter soli]WCL55183.1 hypothetical protein PH603_05345 [Gimibacter soli]
MSDREMLKQASGFFKSHYPGLMPEAIVAFLFIAGSEKQLTVGDVARALGMTEPDAYKHISHLAVGRGAGLVQLANLGEGRNGISLTETGMTARADILEKMG